MTHKHWSTPYRGTHFLPFLVNFFIYHKNIDKLTKQWQKLTKKIQNCIPPSGRWPAFGCLISFMESLKSTLCSTLFLLFWMKRKKMQKKKFISPSLRMCAATKSWSKYTTINCCEVISLLDVVSRFCKQVSLKHNIQGILVTVFEVNSQKSFQVFNRSLGHKFLSKTVLKS